MNRVSIIVDDKIVIVDGEDKVVDNLEDLEDKNIHAVQWDNVNKEGTIEYKDNTVKDIRRTSDFNWKDIKSQWNKIKSED